MTFNICYFDVNILKQNLICSKFDDYGIAVIAERWKLKNEWPLELTQYMSYAEYTMYFIYYKHTGLDYMFV